MYCEYGVPPEADDYWFESPRFSLSYSVEPRELGDHKSKDGHSPRFVTDFFQKKRRHGEQVALVAGNRDRKCPLKQPFFTSKIFEFGLEIASVEVKRNSELEVVQTAQRT